MVVKSDARKRLDLVLAPQETVLTIPLEPFAMQRLQDRLKDLVSGYGMARADRLHGGGERRAAGARGGRLRLLVGAKDAHAGRSARLSAPADRVRREGLTPMTLWIILAIVAAVVGLCDLHLQPPGLARGR